MKKPFHLNNLTIQSFVTSRDKIKGGAKFYTQDVNECGESNHWECTFDECLSQGPGCSDWQVC